jgi:hypothetical protein
MPTVTLLIPGVRTLPTANRMYIFQSGKREGGIPEEVALRCEATNTKEKREVFKVERSTDQMAIVHGNIKANVEKSSNKALRRTPELAFRTSNQLEFPGWT